MEETILNKAEFDPKIKLYWYINGIFVHFFLIFAGIGLVTLPIWIVVGLFLVSKRYQCLSAHLTDRSIHLKSGWLFRLEKTIPLEKIQDLSLRTGPLLNAFGLASVQVETAGGGAQQGADMSLPGLRNADEFRNAVLSQRDQRSGVPTTAPAASDDSLAVLSDIRDSLNRIEELLKANNA
ncbi:MAG: PH domain-containing protein [Proteobacteria bacterium]|jgi:putative membrane protein|nr:PH domain-containing protein [Pseudomonadota bacterium]